MLPSRTPKAVGSRKPTQPASTSRKLFHIEESKASRAVRWARSCGACSAFSVTPAHSICPWVRRAGAVAIPASHAGPRPEALKHEVTFPARRQLPISRLRRVPLPWPTPVACRGIGILMTPIRPSRGQSEAAASETQEVRALGGPWEQRRRVGGDLLWLLDSPCQPVGRLIPAEGSDRQVPFGPAFPQNMRPPQRSTTVPSEHTWEHEIRHGALLSLPHSARFMCPRLQTVLFAN